MELFEGMLAARHCELLTCTDADLGLRAFISIHSLALGPSLGGVRFWHYPNEAGALRDAMRLAEAMSYKASLAGLPLGGGKSVVLAPSAKAQPTEAWFVRFGEFIESLGGRYIAAEDVGTNEQCMDWLGRSTKYVTGGTRTDGVDGDPSPWTALGILEGIRSAVDVVLGRKSLDGLKVAVQGTGHVGQHVCRLLAGEGVKLTVSDINDARAREVAKQVGATVVPVGEILFQDVDVLSPAALGDVLGDYEIPRLKCRLVAGPTNNQLVNAEKHCKMLADRGITYIPDFLINAGGLIHVGAEWLKKDQDWVRQQVMRIGATTRENLAIAEEKGITTAAAALHQAKARIHKAEQQGRA
jgi:leucine dehydrogenase